MEVHDEQSIGAQSQDLDAEINTDSLIYIRIKQKLNDEAEETLLWSTEVIVHRQNTS